MVANNQQAALARVLAHEGGNVDDPCDPGGRTSKGVTQRVYDAWRHGQNLPQRDVFLIATTEMRAIYMEQYWHRVRADDLPRGLDYAVFDAAVNSGPVQAVKWLQRALGNIRVDGVVGQVTLAAVRAHADMAVLIAALCACRMTFLKQLRTWKHFGGGWTRRVNDVERVATAMVAGRKTGGDIPTGGGAARAETSQIRVVRGAGVAQTIAGAGLATAAAAEAIGGALRQAAEELGAASQQFSALSGLVSWLAATGAVLLAGGVSWRLYLGWRQQMVSDATDMVVDVRDPTMARRRWL